MITMKEFARRHGVKANTLYQRAQKRGIVLKAIKINKSPVYYEEDLLQLVPPQWKPLLKKKKRESG